ncbi:MAG: chloride channel protein [Melioribacteraceae bacterium]
MYSYFKKIKQFTKKTISKIHLPDYSVFTIYSILIGAAVGFAAVLFHNSIEFFNDVFFKQTAGGLYFLGAFAVITIPAIGMFIQSMMIRSMPDIASKRGVSEVIKSVASKKGNIPFRNTVFHFIAPVICIGSGGTVGPEGPAAQLGGGVASKLSTLLNISDQRKRMYTAAGAGAAIAAIFNSPLGGIFFALEIVLLNEFETATFSALILSSVTASTISRTFLGNNSVFQFHTPSIGSFHIIFHYAILGVFIGAISFLFVKYSNLSDEFIKKQLLTRFPRWVVMVMAGLLVGAAGYFYSDIFGIGYKAINHMLQNRYLWSGVLILFGMKFLLVPLVLNSGGYGGIFAPALFMGACLGYLYAFVMNYFFGLNLDPTAFLLVGMGAMLGGINSIPISAILIIFEMTKDYTYILPLMLAVVSSTMFVQITLKNSIHLQSLARQGYRFSEKKSTNVLKSIFTEEILRKEINLIPEETKIAALVNKLSEVPHSIFYLYNSDKKITGYITETELRPIISEYEHIQSVLVVRDIAQTNIVKVFDSDDLDHVMKIFENRDVDELPVFSLNNPDVVLGSVWRKDVISMLNKENLKQNLADGFAKELKTIDVGIQSRVAEGYSIIEIAPRRDFIGKSLSLLRLRNRYGLEVLLIKKPRHGYMSESGDKLIIADPNYKIEGDDILVLFGPDDKISETKQWENM